DGNTLTMAGAHDADAHVLQLARELLATPMAVVPVQQRVLDTGEAYLAPDMSSERAHQTTNESRAAVTDRIGMHTVLPAALCTRGVPLGVINLVRHRADRPGYDDRDRALAQQLADHAAVAISNARLLRARYDQLRLAHESTERANRELEAFSYSVAH